MRMRDVTTRIILEQDGKVVLPDFMLKALEWEPGRVLELILENAPGHEGHISFYAELEQCHFCGDYEGPFYKYREYPICKECQGEIEELRPKLEEE